MININQIKDAGKVLLAIKNVLSKRILATINEHPGITVKEIYNGMLLEQSVVSHHLGTLKRSGFVRSERDGQSVHYYAHHENINVMRLLVQQLSSYFQGVDSKKL